MVIIGVDAHKRSHTCVAVDAAGRKIGEKTVETTGSGHAVALRWARSRYGSDLKWGIEDCRQVSSRFEQDLLSAGQRVVRVPTKMMARTRASARTRGKSDPIDAREIARAVLREPDLPAATHDSVSRSVRLLVDRREDLLQQRTGTTNRLLWRVHELDPRRSADGKPLKHAKHRRLLGEWLDTESGLVAEIARDELDEIAQLSEKINALEKLIVDRVRSGGCSLVEIPGCAEITAAKIIGETANITRFKNEAAFARYIGVAPLPQWSGCSTGRMRMTRSGNRQINVALHRIALSQIRMDGPGRAYYRKRIAAGDPPASALRKLKRRVSRVVFTRLRADHNRRHCSAHARHE